MTKHVYVLKYNMYKSAGGTWALKFNQVLRKNEDAIEKIGRSTYMFFDPNALVDVVDVLSEYKHIIGLDFVFKVDLHSQMSDPYIRYAVDNLTRSSYNQQTKKLSRYIQILTRYLIGKESKKRAISVAYPSVVAKNVLMGYIRMADPKVIDKYKKLALIVQKKTGIQNTNVLDELQKEIEKLENERKIALEELKKITKKVNNE